MGIHLGLIEADPSIETKINTKHNCTLEEVRQALQYPAKARAGWEEDPEHGLRVVALGTTGAGRLLIGWLLPIPPWDENSDTWVIKSSRWVD